MPPRSISRRLAAYHAAHRDGERTSAALQGDAAELIRHACETLGVTQQELARRLGKTKVHLSNIRRGKAVLTLAVAARIHELIQSAKQGAA